MSFYRLRASLGFEALEPRLNLSSAYDLKVIAQTGVDGLTSIAPGASLNDNGQIAFVATQSIGQSVFVGDGTAPASIVSFLSPSATRTYGTELQINNAGRVAAVDIVGSGRLARIWDTNSPGTFTTVGRSSAPRLDTTHFDGLSGTAALSNDGNLAFAGLESPLAPSPSFWEVHLSNSFVDRRDAFSLTTEVKQIDIPPSAFFRYRAADGERVLVANQQNSQTTIMLHEIDGLDNTTTIASTLSGWLGLGIKPAISDDGSMVAFSGSHPTLGAGIFVYGGGITSPLKVSGVSGDGILDMNETWNDNNSNGNVDAGEDVGPFGSFTESLDMSLGIGYSYGPGLPKMLTVAFMASDVTSHQGLYTLALDARNPGDVKPVQLLNVTGIGGTIAGLAGNVASIGVNDLLNNVGEVGFVVTMDTGAQAVVRGGIKDSDGDGLYDIWETDGIDVNGDGVVDLNLPSLGANPMHKDLFVEYDAMVGRAPAEVTLDRVVQAFSQAPNALLNNPDNQAGIHLVLQRDELNLSLHDFPNAFDDFSTVKNVHFGTPAERASSNWQNIYLAKQIAYRYAIFGNTYSSDTSSGLAELSGNDFMVTLGGWSTPGGTPDQQAGTFMHELGHTLGLGHGGGDSVHYKPNYYSVMNYLWQTPKGYGNWRLNYSTEDLPDLVESNLSELTGIGGPANVMVPIGPSGGPLRLVKMSGPVDWNDDGDVADTGVTANLNRDVSAGQEVISTLTGFEDWSHLVFNFRRSAHAADGSIYVPDATHTELTFELDQHINKSVTPSSPDFNSDGMVDGSDFLAWQRGYGITNGASRVQGDSNGDGDVDGDDLSNWRSNFGSNGNLTNTSTDQLSADEVSNLFAGAALSSAALMTHYRAPLLSAAMRLQFSATTIDAALDDLTTTIGSRYSLDPWPNVRFESVRPQSIVVPTGTPLWPANCPPSNKRLDINSDWGQWPADEAILDIAFTGVQSSSLLFSRIN